MSDRQIQYADGEWSREYVVDESVANVEQLRCAALTMRQTALRQFESQWLIHLADWLDHCADGAWVAFGDVVVVSEMALTVARAYLDQSA